MKPKLVSFGINFGYMKPKSGPIGQTARRPRCGLAQGIPCRLAVDPRSPGVTVGPPTIRVRVRRLEILSCCPNNRRVRQCRPRIVVGCAEGSMAAC
jgi:hypothetical protein